MQLYARDHQGELVAASRARRQCDYACLECQGIVRVRAGVHRQPHFYHLHLNPLCRQSQKSMEHLQTQSHLQRLIGVEACRLEVPFPAIQRIADAVWDERKLVFEVQVSPISAAEVGQRTRDYSSQGYQVVWILHDGTFNQWRLRAAEQYLLHRSCYYTNIDVEGNGLIYDQYALRIGGLLHRRLDPLEVLLHQPKQALAGVDISECLARRLESTSLYFAGDLVDLAISHPQHPYLEQMRQWELEMRAFQPIPGETPWWHPLLRGYQILFRLLLERVCR